MVRNKNVAALRINMVESFHGNPNSAYPQQSSRPDASNADLGGPGSIEERNNQAGGSEKNRGQNDGGIG
jgi:hypothetical protein